jgi:hypothetical protein
VNKIQNFNYSVLRLLAAFVFFLITPCQTLAQTTSARCEQNQNLIERKLLENPSDTNLQLAYLLILKACKAETQSAPTLETQVQIRTYIGNSSNPENASQTEYFNLNLGEQVVKLPNQKQPSPSQFAGINTRLLAKKQRHQVQFEADIQRYNQSDIDQQAYITLDYYYLDTFHYYNFSLLQGHYQSTHYTQFGVGGGYMLHNGWIAKADFSQRIHAKHSILDASLYRTGLISPKISLKHWGEVGLQLNYQYDQPRNADRAGGANNLYQAGLSYQKKWSKHQWTALAQGYIQQDTKGYSTLLNRNATRHLNLLQAQVEWAWQYNRQLQIQTQYSYAQQISNIPLFDWQSHQVRAGVLYRW